MSLLWSEFLSQLNPETCVFKLKVTLIVNTTRFKQNSPQALAFDSNIGNVSSSLVWASQGASIGWPTSSGVCVWAHRIVGPVPGPALSWTLRRQCGWVPSSLFSLLRMARVSFITCSLTMKLFPCHHCKLHIFYIIILFSENFKKGVKNIAL